VLLEERTPELAAFIEAEDRALGSGDLAAAVQANVDAWVVGPRRTTEQVAADVQARVAEMQRRAFEITAGWDEAEELEHELEPPAPERYGDVRAPTLVLTGSFDLDAIHAAAARVVGAVPGARLVTWPDTAHLPSLERPADFTRLLLEHLGTVGASG
jgi:pimeloyl-ACP methyl ester carboxylesterase